MTRFRAKGWVAAAAALIVALSQAGAGGAEPPKLTQPVQATKGDDNPLRTYSGPAMAVDPGDPLRVVASFVDMRTRRCGLLRSTDGGKTWRRLDASPALDSYPSCLSTNSSIFHGPIAFGRNGSLYYALSGWDVQDRQGGEVSSAYNSSVQLGRSKDLGDTWETTIVRDARGKQGKDFEGNRPLTGIAVDTKNGPDDIVYVAWRRELNNNVSPNAVPRVPMVAVSSDGGRTFADPVDLAKGVFDPPSVRADALKTVTTLAGTNTTTTLAPAGSKAGQPDQADNFGGGNPAIALDGKGNVYAVWATNFANLPSGPAAALHLSKSTDRGKTWTSSIVAPFDHKNRGSFPGPRLAWSPKGGADGTLHLVAECTSKPEVAAYIDICYRQSVDGGAKWTDPKVINDDDASQLRAHVIPEVAVAPNGRVDVTWWDTRDDPGVYGNDVYYAASDDNGKTWSKNIRVTDRTIDRRIGVWGFNFDMSSPPGLASTDEFALLAWDDTRNADPTKPDTVALGGGLQDIYTSAIQYEAVGGGASRTAQYALAGVVGLLVVGLALTVVALAARRRDGTPPATIREASDQESAGVG